MSTIDPRNLGTSLEEATARFRFASDRRMESGNATDLPRTPLFHYTSEKAFESIIATEQFWFSSIYHMDDKEELNFGFDVCGSVLRSFFERADKIVKLFIEPLISTGFREEIRSIVEFYSISFGTRNDPEQWSRYGGNSKGVAIGLTPNFFRLTAPEDPKPEEKVFVGRVAYGEKAAKARHQRVVQSVTDFIKREYRLGSIPNGETAQALFRRLTAEMYVEVLWNCVTTKSANWKRQNETRLLVLNRIKDPQLPVHSDRGRPYVKIPEPTLKQSLSEILLGPDAERDTEATVRSFLAQRGLNNVGVTRTRRPTPSTSRL